MHDQRDIVTSYARSILDGERAANKWIQLAALRFVNDLERSDLTMDWDGVRRLDEHFSGLELVGADTGKPFRLHPWQLFALANLWCWRWKATGRRRVKRGLLQVARGNGKTTLVSGLALWDMLQSPGARVHVVANTERQAEICFDTAQTMARRAEKLGFRNLYDRIVIAGNDCEMTTLPAQGRALDGLNPSLWIADEAAEFKGRFLTKLLTTRIKRLETLGVIISTPGSTSEGIYEEQISKAHAVLEGETEDDGYIPLIYGIDSDDAIEDESAWLKANPGMEHGQPDLQSLRDQWVDMRGSPEGRAEFCRYHCARMNEDSGGWLDMSLWPRHDPVDWAELRGRPVWVGLDLSKSLDMTACVIACPLDDGRVALKGTYWWPKENVAQRELDYRLPIRTWAADGRIVLTPGREIDYEMVRIRLNEIAREFDVRAIAYDRWGAKYLVEVLEGDGLPVQAYSQGIATFGPGCQLWQQLWAGGKILCGEDQILRAACRTALAKRDMAGNIRLTKEGERKTIDALVASIMAIHSWGGQARSVYEDL